MRNRRYLLFDPNEGTGGNGGTGEGTGGEGAGTGSGEPPEGTGTGSGSSSGSQEPNEELQRTRQEAAKYRTERNALQKRVEELEGAGKSEVEKLTGAVTEKDQVITKLQADNRRLRAMNLAPSQGISGAAAADAASLLDWSTIEDPESDDHVAKALKSLVKEKPYLAGSVRDGADGGAGGSREEKQDMNSLLRQAAGRE